MPKEHRQRWEKFRDGLTEVKEPAVTVQLQKPKKTRVQRNVKMDDMPVLQQGGSSREASYKPFPAESENIVVDEESSDEDFDGDDPLYRVDAIVGRRTGELGIEYKVRWGDQYLGEETWEPLENLAGAQAMVDEFERIRSGVGSGLTHHAKAHAELGRELREQAEREANSKMVACRHCGKLFKRVATHEKKCHKNPLM